MFLRESKGDFFAGLTFGVSPETGIQLLLAPEIRKALTNHKDSNISDLVKKHEQYFWTVFNYIIKKDRLGFSQRMSYAYIIHKYLSKYSQKINDYTYYLQVNMGNNVGGSPINEDSARNCAEVLHLVDDKEELWKKIISDHMDRGSKKLLFILWEEFGESKGVQAVDPGLGYPRWRSFFDSIEDDAELERLSRVIKPNVEFEKNFTARASMDGADCKILNMALRTNALNNPPDTVGKVVEHLYRRIEVIINKPSIDQPQLKEELKLWDLVMPEYKPAGEIIGQWTTSRFSSKKQALMSNLDNAKKKMIEMAKGLGS